MRVTRCSVTTRTACQLRQPASFLRSKIPLQGIILRSTDILCPPRYSTAAPTVSNTRTRLPAQGREIHRGLFAVRDSLRVTRKNYARPRSRSHLPRATHAACTNARQQNARFTRPAARVHRPASSQRPTCIQSQPSIQRGPYTRTLERRAAMIPHACHAQRPNTRALETR